MIGLDPESVLDRIQRDGRPVSPPTLVRSTVIGAVGFAVVGITAFSLWAFAARAMTRTLGSSGFYSLIAVTMLAGGTLVFRPLVIGRNLGRFAALFAVGFTLFAASWMTGYTVRLPYRLGEWTGVIVGPVLLAGTLCIGFGASKQFFICAGILAASHFGSYLAADRLFSIDGLKNTTGMLIWGLVYGAGFGAGIAATLYFCQQEIRSQMSVVAGTEPPAPRLNRS